MVVQHCISTHLGAEKLPAPHPFATAGEMFRSWTLDYQFGVHLSHTITPLPPVENFPTVIGLSIVLSLLAWRRLPTRSTTLWPSLAAYILPQRAFSAVCLSRAPVYGKANGSLVLTKNLNRVLGRWLTNGSVGSPRGPPNLNSRRWFSARFGTKQ